MSIEIYIAIAVTVIGAATPILLAALGELVVEKAGVLNLGRRGHDAGRRGHRRRVR